LLEAESHAARTLGSEFWYYAKAGMAFLHSEELANASVGDTSALSATNPDGSGVTAVFDLTRATPGARTMTRVYDAFSSAPPDGDETGIENVLLDSAGGAPDTGDVTTAVDPAYTPSGDSHMSEATGGGQGAPSSGGKADVPILALEPGRKMVFEAEKLRTDGEECPMTLRWFEVPTVYSEDDPRPAVHEVTRS
jgi:hypothetical protein